MLTEFKRPLPDGADAFEKDLRRSTISSLTRPIASPLKPLRLTSLQTNNNQV
jgi:hypothetical protein